MPPIPFRFAPGAVVKPVDLRSDTVTRPTPEMRGAIAGAEVGDDVFGDDPTVAKLEETTAGLLGKEAALFVPSGHMGNEIALAVHGRPGREVIVEELSHIMTAEGGAPAALAGVTLRPVRSDHGRIDPGTVEAALTLDDDPHHAPTALVCVENTHNRHGGRALPAEVVDALGALARTHAIPLHLDGARLWNASAALDTPVDRLARAADSVAVCFSKGLGAPIGSALAGSASFIREARRLRKRFGGGMRQAGLLAAAALFALEYHRDRLREDHRRARRLAAEVPLPPGAFVVGGVPDTNIVIWQFELASPEIAALRARIERHGVRVVPFGPGQLRAVTHLDIDDDDIDRAVAALSAEFPGVATGSPR
jgi:threonine aldolase